MTNRWFFFLMVIPAVEIASIVLMTQWIGGAATFLWIVAAFVLGTFVMRYAGRSWWSGLRAAAGAPDPGGVSTSPQPPDTARMADQGLLFLAGFLIAVPGFVGDLVGLLLLLPFVRKAFRLAAAAWFVRRFSAVNGPGGFVLWQRDRGPASPGPGTTRVERVYPGEIVQGEVLDDDDGGGGQRPRT